VTGRVMRVRLQLVRVTIAFVKSVNPLIRKFESATMVPGSLIRVTNLPWLAAWSVAL
jgi:hypothetical protein